MTGINLVLPLLHMKKLPVILLYVLMNNDTHQTQNTRALTLDRIAVDLFFNPHAVDALAAYLVAEHSDARVQHAHDLLDSLVEGIVRSEMGMRVIAFRHVPGLDCAELRTVAW